MDDLLKIFIEARNKLIEITEEDALTGKEPLFCMLHNGDFLGEESSQSSSHNCIGCNLQNGNDYILRFLNSIKSVESEEDIEYTMTLFFLLLYLQVEKILLQQLLSQRKLLYFEG